MLDKYMNDSCPVPRCEKCEMVFLNQGAVNSHPCVSVTDFVHDINMPWNFIPYFYILYGYVAIARENCVDIRDIYS